MLHINRSAAKRAKSVPHARSCTRADYCAHDAMTAHSHLLIKLRKFRAGKRRQPGRGSLEMHKIALENASGRRGVLAADDKAHSVDAFVAESFAFKRRRSSGEGLAEGLRQCGPEAHSRCL